MHDVEEELGDRIFDNDNDSVCSDYDNPEFTESAKNEDWSLSYREMNLCDNQLKVLFLDETLNSC